MAEHSFWWVAPDFYQRPDYTKLISTMLPPSKGGGSPAGGVAPFRLRQPAPGEVIE
jgi:hypothetical protein